MVSGLRPVPAERLTEADLGWLVKIAQSSPYGHTSKQLLLMALNRKVQLWRIEGKATGLILTSREEWPKGSELRVWGMAGKNVFPAQAKFLIDDLLKVCVKYNCRWLAFTNIHPAMDKFYARWMGKPFGTTFVRELK